MRVQAQRHRWYVKNVTLCGRVCADLIFHAKSVRLLGCSYKLLCAEVDTTFLSRAVAARLESEEL